MSETPETDAAAFVYREANSEHGLVTSDRARSLERRLTAMTRERDEAKRHLAICQDTIGYEKSRQLKDERDKARACLRVCAGLAEHWRMQASVTSRRSAWSANGALEKCAVELEKALALDQIGKEANE